MTILDGRLPTLLRHHGEHVAMVIPTITPTGMDAYKATCACGTWGGVTFFVDSFRGRQECRQEARQWAEAHVELHEVCGGWLAPGRRASQ